VKGLIAALLALFVLGGCSRSTSLSGEIRIRSAAGEAGPPPRTAVLVVRSTPALDATWAERIAAFQAAAAPLRSAVEKATQASVQARKTWDRAVASRGGRVISNPQAVPASRGWERLLWLQVRDADARLVQAKRQLRELSAEHGRQAEALLEANAQERVATDETGHFVVAGIALGPALIYAHAHTRDQDVAWLVPLTLKGGLQELVLSEDSPNVWPFHP